MMDNTFRWQTDALTVIEFNDAGQIALVRDQMTVSTTPTPAQARALAACLFDWADETEGKNHEGTTVGVHPTHRHRTPARYVRDLVVLARTPDGRTGSTDGRG